MFKEFEKSARKELISFYEDYIKNPEDSTLEERALKCEQKYSSVSVLSKDVSYAGFKCISLALKELDINEAKEILNKLKKI